MHRASVQFTRHILYAACSVAGHEDGLYHQWRSVAVSGGEVHAIILLLLCVLLRGDRERIIVVIDTARIAGDPERVAKRRHCSRGVLINVLT